MAEQSQSTIDTLEALDKIGHFPPTVVGHERINSELIEVFFLDEGTHEQPGTAIIEYSR